MKPHSFTIQSFGCLTKVCTKVATYASTNSIIQQVKESSLQLFVTDSAHFEIIERCSYLYEASSDPNNSNPHIFIDISLNKLRKLPLR